jgi:carboxymethylenebutenolidase
MEIQAEMIEFASNGRSTPGYLARPAGEGGFPALVAIQEWWGLVPHIQEVAERFARAGFVVLAPDLYHGRQAAEPDEARKLSMELDRPAAVQEIIAALQYLQDQDFVAPKKVGLVGWCMGGALTITTAARLGKLQTGPRLGAAVAFYGMPPDLGIVRHIQAPLLGLYGEDDHGIPVAKVRALQSELEQNAIEHEIKVYPQAGHAFFNETRPSAYQPAAAADAWDRTLAWFRTHLSG